VRWSVLAMGYNLTMALFGGAAPRATLLVALRG
jgi:hypothetical protein